MPNTPLATYRPHDQYIENGNPARLYCEAFVGRMNIPDARTFVSWYQIFDRDRDQEQEVDGKQTIIER